MLKSAVCNISINKLHQLQSNGKCPLGCCETRPWWGGGQPVIRQMLRHNAIEALEAMLKTGGWQRLVKASNTSSHPSLSVLAVSWIRCWGSG